ncbi:MAG: hypothetical protein K2K29_03195, partial [Muribaculaceae bacterium]|nr:hypothetical protein [Muribaculaceae bacterium]
MRYFLISLLTFLTLSASAAKSVMTSEHFAKSSRLASGKWVKVAVDEDGIYEISYETLKNMGFSNPESVGVFGRGGSMMPTEFASSGGQILYRDDLPAVPVFRMNDKIYFYGKGTMQLDFERNLVKYQNGGAFTRGAMNIYSKEGYYFLSDSQEPLLMEEVQIPESPKYVKEFTSGIGVAAHEEDLVYNTHSTGQLYYGEKMTPQQPRLRFQLNLPDAIPGAMGVVQSVVYTDKILSLRHMSEPTR